MKENVEIRNVKGIEIRVDDPTKQSRLVCGYAIRFNEQSENLGFYEVIEAGALTQEQVDSADIFAYYNHDTEKVLARSINGEGTLKLKVDEQGLYFEFEAPDTEVGNELLEHIRRGELFGTSFGFIVMNEGSDTWEKKDDVWYRTIHHIDYLFEVSPVFSPAYTTTTCQTRNKEKIESMDSILNDLDKRMQDVLDGLKDYNVGI